MTQRPRYQLREAFFNRPMEVSVVRSSDPISMKDVMRRGVLADPTHWALPFLKANQQARHVNLEVPGENSMKTSKQTKNCHFFLGLALRLGKKRKQRASWIVRRSKECDPHSRFFEKFHKNKQRASWVLHGSKKYNLRTRFSEKCGDNGS